MGCFRSCRPADPLSRVFSGFRGFRISGACFCPFLSAINPLRLFPYQCCGLFPVAAVVISIVVFRCMVIVLILIMMIRCMLPMQSFFHNLKSGVGNNPYIFPVVSASIEFLQGRNPYQFSVFHHIYFWVSRYSDESAVRQIGKIVIGCDYRYCSHNPVFGNRESIILRFGGTCAAACEKRQSDCNT